MHQVIVDMEVDDDSSYESEYRIQMENLMKYVVIAPGTFDRDTLSLPLAELPHLPCDKEWTVANISRNGTTKQLQTEFSARELSGVQCQWHPMRIDWFSIRKLERLTPGAFEAVAGIPHDALPEPPQPFIAKIARFEWEIPRLEQETRAYQLLEGTGIAPKFLGHISEHGRVIGFAVEKAPGRAASVEALDVCVRGLRRFHELGLLHGDVNKHNFVVSETGVKLIDFANTVENADVESMDKETASLQAELTDESGRGAGFIFREPDAAE